MARQDFTTDDYIIEEKSSTVVQVVQQNSVVESLARRENMNTSTKAVPSFYTNAVDVVAEGEQIAEAEAYKNMTILEAKKWAKIMHISEEDLNDSFIDVLNTYKSNWATSFAKKFDNACLGVNAAANGTTVPYTSLYKSLYDAADDGWYNGLIQTGGDVTFADLSNVLAKVESSVFFDPSKIVFFAHPTFMQSLRNLEDDNHRPILQSPLGATGSTLFGYPIMFSQGLATSDVATDSPSGNPLLFVGNKDLMINGVRAGIESVVSRDAKFDTDGVLLKIRARRAFALPNVTAFAAIEKTPA